MSKAEKGEGAGRTDRIAQVAGLIAGVLMALYVGERALTENGNSLFGAIIIGVLLGVGVGAVAWKFAQSLRAFLSGELFDDWERVARKQGEIDRARKASVEADRAARKAERDAAAARPAPAGGTASRARAASPAPAPAAAGAPPPLLEEPRDGQGDDLKRVKGVGPKMAAALNAAGIWHFDQIAAWTPAEIAWVDAEIEGVRGRAAREDWVGQAKALQAEG